MDELPPIHFLHREMHAMQTTCMFRLMAEDELHPGQIQLLSVLHHLGDCQQNSLARAMHVSPASIGVSIRRLEQAGYITKTTTPSDLRSNTISLAEKGLNAAETGEKKMRRFFSQQMSGFSPDEINQYQDYLMRMIENLIQFQSEFGA